MASKMTEYMAGRQDGLILARNIVKERGLEGLDNEIQFRNASGIHSPLMKKDLEQATMKIKNMSVDTFLVLSVATLRDEFDFGAKRCNRFVERMNQKAECLVDDMATWQDFIDSIRDEMGIELRIRYND